MALDDENKKNADSDHRGLSIFVILASSQSPPQFFWKSGSVAAQTGILASSQSSWDDFAEIVRATSFSK